MFQNKMFTPAIPERVFTLCKLVEKKTLSSSEVKDKMEPAYLNQATSYFAEYRTAAEELLLITNIDNTLSLAVDPVVISDMNSMRYYVNGQLDRFRDGHFYKVTNAYYSLGEQILHGEQNVANMALSLSQLADVQVDSMGMRAWRFWASYLGFGYLQDMFLIPNSAVFLQDVMNRCELKKNYRYPISDFLARLRPYLDIIVDFENGDKRFSFGVSNGLRTLQDSGVIKMEYIMDQEDSWNLYHIDALSAVEKVTNVTILM